MVTSFKDLGKSTRELFDKHFKFGLLNFEFKTKTSNDITVTCGGKHEVDSKLVSGYLESKTKPASGVSLKTRIDSGWVVTSDLEIEKKFHENLTQNLLTTVETESGKKSLSFQNKFKHDNVNVGFDMDFKAMYPQLSGSFVVPVPRYNRVVFGAQAVFDSESAKLKKYVYAVGYKQHHLRADATLTDHSVVNLNVFQKLKDMELGFRVGWNKDTRATNFGAVVLYKPSKNTKLKAKVDQNGIVGLSYKVELDSDTSLTFCTQLDGKNLESGGHKYGLAFQYGD
ncbi:unnamed protein product [Calicophoron daubneyi]|uniref:Voltage-dependent anion-selective channel protein 3 n=1 Tax=Calicophoron daubneyi TaxID=300641 RepID=A0AAV2T093_CALDB